METSIPTVQKPTWGYLRNSQNIENKSEFTPNRSHRNNAQLQEMRGNLNKETAIDWVLELS